MSYAGKFLNSRGQNCTIKRTPAVTSKVSLRRSTSSSRDLGAREAYWEGLILAEAGLASGEYFSIGSDNYLVQTVSPDQASGEQALFVAKCNVTLQHQRIDGNNIDANNNFINSWPTINANVSAYGEIITYRMRQEDPGLLDSTKYTFQVPKSLGIVKLDRLVYNDDPYEIVSIDDIGMSGVVRVQAAVDVRP